MKYNNVIYYKPQSQYINIADLPYFCIIGRCLKGSRHFSEFMSYEDAIAVMPKYIGVVEYFGGGTVELLNHNGDIIKFKRV